MKFITAKACLLVLAALSLVSLTNAQKKVLKEIRRDIGSGRQMNRLIQGDVGSGKTLVALMSMLIAIGNEYQPQRRPVSPS